MFNVTIKLTSLEDVKNFFIFLANATDRYFTVMDDFYLCVDRDGKSIFTDEMAQNLNQRMQEAFDICEANNENIYEICCHIQAYVSQEKMMA